MSLVSTWVQSIDGKFYENPVVEGPGWFVCFDDDDPPEIVMTEGLTKNVTPAIVLEEAGFEFGQIKKASESGRIFKSGIKPARSWFFYLNGPIPVPNRFDSVAENQPSGQGVYYAFEAKST